MFSLCVLVCPVGHPFNRDVSLFSRCKDSVKHFNVTWMGDGYRFGMGVYASLKEFIDHFDNQPLIAGESGEPGGWTGERAEWLVLVELDWSGDWGRGASGIG